MMMVHDREPYPSGTRDYLTATVTLTPVDGGDEESTLSDDLVVRLSIDDRATWLDARWLGVAGLVRRCQTEDRVLLELDADAGLAVTRTVYVAVGPVYVEAGSLTITR